MAGWYVPSAANFRDWRGASLGGPQNQQPAAPAPQQEPPPQYKHPPNAIYESDDGLISYDENFNQLDSNGNVAIGSFQIGSQSPRRNYAAAYVPKRYGQVASVMPYQMDSAMWSSPYSSGNLWNASGSGTFWNPGQ